MRGTLLFSFVLFILLVGGFVAVYFLYEKPAQEVITEFVNISISARNEDNELIRTGYRILLDGNLFKSGVTKKGSYLIENNIPVNKTLSIYNFNLDNQSYYTIEPKIYLTRTNATIKRLDLKLIEVSNYSIKHTGIFGKDNIISLIVSTDNIDKVEKNVITCLTWGPHIISANIENRTRYSYNNEKCYLIDEIGKNELLRVKITSLGVFSSLDYLKIKFMNINKDPLEGEILLNKGDIYEINYD